MSVRTITGNLNSPLALIRLSRGWSQAELSAQSRRRLGEDRHLQVSTISKIEGRGRDGAAFAYGYTLLALSETLDVPIERFFEDPETMPERELLAQAARALLDPRPAPEASPTFTPTEPDPEPEANIESQTEEVEG